MGDNKRVVIATPLLGVDFKDRLFDLHHLLGMCKIFFKKMDVDMCYLNSKKAVEYICDPYIAPQKMEALTKDDTVKIVIADFDEVSVPPEEILNLVKIIRNKRKDIFLVSIRHVKGMNEKQMYLHGLNVCKTTSSNLVLVANIETKYSMVVVPEEAFYHLSSSPYVTLTGLLDMASLRSHLTFTQSTVVEGNPIAWDSILVPEVLRSVVDYCIKQHAYKPFNGVTAGHFAVKLDDNTFLSSIRKTNFNNLYEVGLVKVVTDGPDTVLAYGAKPSVGGQSQRIVFRNHSEYDCVLHFHCPLKEESKIPVVSQREFECGSHECGQNTSNGLMKFGDNLSAVYLHNHGPNIVFDSKKTTASSLINFIEENFDLSRKTGGYVSPKEDYASD